MEEDGVVAERVNVHRVQLQRAEQDLVGRFDVADALQNSCVLPQRVDLLPLVAVVAAPTISVVALVIVAVILSSNRITMSTPVRRSTMTTREVRYLLASKSPSLRKSVLAPSAGNDGAPNVNSH